MIFRNRVHQECGQREGLNAFENLVRTRMARIVDHLLGVVGLSYIDAIVITVPLFGAICDMFAAEFVLKSSFGSIAYKVVEQGLFILFLVPIAVAAIFCMVRAHWYLQLTRSRWIFHTVCT